MAGTPNYLNVYRGPDSVSNYFDLDSSSPLPLVEIPGALNPYRQHGVRIYAKMMSMHPVNNVKCMPAMNLLAESIKLGKTKTVVEYSSGSTALSMALVSRACNDVHDMRTFLSNKTSREKIRLMQLFGIDMLVLLSAVLRANQLADPGDRTLFGGPSQPEPMDQRGGIRAAQKMAQESDSATVNPNQYANDNNWKVHVKWTGPQILRQLPEINLICASMGTSGTMSGLGLYFKQAKPSVFRLGVCTAQGDRVPGPRSYALLRPVEFPWRSAVDHIEEVGSHDSYSLSLDLIRQGIICGPSSGFNLRGLFQLVEKRKAAGSLRELAGPDGKIHCVFLCCDLPYQYVNEYLDKLGPSYFCPVPNEELMGVDLYRYDETWEREAADAFRDYLDADRTTIKDVLELASELVSGRSKLEGRIQPKKDATIFDLRHATDHDQFRLPGSVNIPFVHHSTPSPFSDPEVLKDLWLRLEHFFKDPSKDVQAAMSDRRVLLLCHDGDSSRVAASVLRNKGVRADSIRGGFNALRKMRSSDTGAKQSSQKETMGAWAPMGLEAGKFAPSESGRVPIPVRVVGSSFA